MKRTYKNLTVELPDDDEDAGHEFNVLALCDEEAGKHYCKVEHYYGRINELPRCPLCLCNFELSCIAEHLLSCVAYRNHLHAQRFENPLKRIQQELKITPVVEATPVEVSQDMQPNNTVPLHSTFKKSDCCVSVDSHPAKGSGTPGVYHTETSVIIQFGVKTAKVCMLEHFVKDAVDIELQFPLPHASTNGNYPCSYPVCQQTCSTVLSVYSVKYPQTPIYKYCSLRCCLAHLEGVSEATFRRSLNNIPHIKLLKEQKGTKNNKEKHV